MAEHPYGVLLDLDGTLVDSVFHHVLAWDTALAEHGHHVPLWRIHAGIGMGGQRLLPWLLGRHVEEASILSDRHAELFLETAHTLRPTPGAQELVDDLARRDVPFLIATSAEAEIRESLMKALGREELRTADADDVASPKPAPDLLLAACDKLGVDPGGAYLIGDSPWDAWAARRVGIRTLAVRTGGFDEDALRIAGMEDVVESPLQLVGRL